MLQTNSARDTEFLRQFIISDFNCQCIAKHSYVFGHSTQVVLYIMKLGTQAGLLADMRDARAHHKGQNPYIGASQSYTSEFILFPVHLVQL